MHYESRPVWRYQWPAALSVVGSAAGMAVISLYGPDWFGARVAHSAVSAALALAVYFLLLAGYRRLAWRYLVDDRTIESYRGVLAREVRSVRIGDLRNVSVKQSVMQRLLDVGDVEFSSAAGGDVEVVFFGVAQPLQVKELVRRLQDGALPASAEDDAGGE